MKLLDLYCGAGGASMGYKQAGFTEITGVDLYDQKNYPFDFIQTDAIEYLIKHGHNYDFIHASPPCKGYTVLRFVNNNEYEKLIEPTRDALVKCKRPYVIENVVGAPLNNPITLCGTMFNLRVIRHRLFECSFNIEVNLECNHVGRASSNNSKTRKVYGKPTLENYEYLTVSGHDFRVSEGRVAMDINWMTRDELSQAIPPAYTKYIGSYFLR